MNHTQIIRPEYAELDVRRIFKLIADEIKQNGKTLTVSVTDKKETRRNAQNRLLWMWHGELAKHIETHQGEIYDTQDIHEFVVGKLLPKRVVTVFNEPEVKRTETSKLKVKPFSEFLNKYEMWAAEKFSCLFTQPVDLYWQALMKDQAA